MKCDPEKIVMMLFRGELILGVQHVERVLVFGFQAIEGYGVGYIQECGNCV